MNNEKLGLDPEDVKQAIKVLRGKVGSWAHARNQTRLYPGNESTRKWHDERRLEVVQQWDTLKNAMEQLGF